MEGHEQNPAKNETTPQNLYILTYNVKTLSSYERLIELKEALKEIKYDILGLAETRRNGNKIEEHENFIFCYTGDTLRFSERVAILNLKLESTSLSIIQVYAPTARASDDEINR